MLHLLNHLFFLLNLVGTGKETLWFVLLRQIVYMNYVSVEWLGAAGEGGAAKETSKDY